MRKFVLFFIAALFIAPSLGRTQALVIDDSQWDSTDIYFPESLESIIFPPNPRWEDLGRIPENSFFRQTSTPVGRLKVRRSDGIALCTAFLVDSGRLLTNNHCVPGNGDVREVVLEMGYLSQGGRIQRYGVQIQPIMTDRALDISLLSLEGDAADSWGAIEFDPQAIGPGDDLFIIHHPGGQTMKLSRVGCFSGPQRALPNGHFLHQCDTIGGSSGSPIFNMQGRVVGIHHRGTPDRGPDAYNRGTQMADAAAFLNLLTAAVRPGEGKLSPTDPPSNNAFESLEEFSFEDGTCDQLAAYRGNFDGDINSLRAYLVYLSCYTKRFEMSDSQAIDFEDHYNFHARNSIFDLLSCDDLKWDIGGRNRINEWSESEFLFSATCDLSRLEFGKVRRATQYGEEPAGQNNYYIWLNTFDQDYWDDVDRAIVAEVEDRN